LLRRKKQKKTWSYKDKGTNWN